jgi:hypothetical protein
MLSVPPPFVPATKSSTAAMLCRTSYCVQCLPANFSIKYVGMGAFLMPEPKGLKVMRTAKDADGKIDHARRDEMAKVAAPFMHPRIGEFRLEPDPDQPNTIDATPESERVVSFRDFIPKRVINGEK